MRTSLVRKQLYITEQQDRARKRQAKARGVSEAELVRQALDEMLRETLGVGIQRPNALDRLLYEQTFPIIPLTPGIVREALRSVRHHRFVYYDAQIWAAARLSQIPVVLSQDFPTGATVEGILFMNPLDEAFDLGTL